MTQGEHWSWENACHAQWDTEEPEEKSGKTNFSTWFITSLFVQVLMVHQLRQYDSWLRLKRGVTLACIVHLRSYILPMKAPVSYKLMHGLNYHL